MCIRDRTQSTWGIMSYLQAVEISQSEGNICFQSSQDQQYSPLNSTLKSDSNTTSKRHFNCSHQSTIKYFEHEYCQACGAHIPKNGVQVYKTEHTNYGAFFIPLHFYEAMFINKQNKKLVLNEEYLQHRNITIEWMLEICDRLRLSINTKHLAVYILDYTLMKKPEYLIQLQLYSTCLLYTSPSPRDS
eukprot:TRINITY_DN10133_c0_g1_i3.p2 TRINITY_DN10133_c0_g1~~TRINITY_DN10133_c0_g1_i3.p2  ORF type:complete len:188 (+),score=24.37 TRINITY_DN10133_c0_g1_i3:61-624(+)